MKKATIPSRNMGVAQMNQRSARNVIELTTVKGESRVDTRVIADQLGIQHKAIIQLVRKYQEGLESLGIMPFQMAKSPRGKPTEYACLSYDQSCFVLTLSSNTEQAVALKLNLVKAFRDARAGRLLKEDYLPCFRECHDAISQLVRASGSETSERIHHMNVEKMINKSLGIRSGERKDLPPYMRTAVSMAERLAGSHYRRAIDAGGDHKQAYKSAKSAVAIYVDSVRDALPILEAAK